MLDHAVETVDGDHERESPRLEIVDGREAIGEASGVDENDCPDGAAHQFIPHEEEAILTGGTEQVEHEVARERQTSEVERDRGGGLAPPASVVDAR